MSAILDLKTALDLNPKLQAANTSAVCNWKETSMLRHAPIRAYIPISDLARARKFYESVVGLVPKEEFAGGVIYECGGAEMFMYPSAGAGTSRASQAFWQVEDVEAEVAERFKDTEGNILAVSQRL